MASRLTVLAVLLALGVPGPGAAADAPLKRIAVLEFTAPDVGVDQKSVTDLTDAARSGALDATRGLPYMVMTKEIVEEILAANAGACAEAECEIQLGRAVGANLLVTGVLAKAGVDYAVTLTLHDIGKGVPLAIRQFMGPDWISLRPIVKMEARRLLEQGIGIDVERLSKGWGVGAAITGTGGVLLAAGIGGIVYGLKTSSDWEQQQPGKADYADPTVTRDEADFAKKVYWAGWGTAAVGAGVTALGVRYILRARASVATPVASAAPIHGGAIAFLTWELP